MYLVNLLFICLILTQMATDQQDKKLEKDRFVVVPREIVLPAIANQPNSPIQFEEVAYVGHIRGSGGATYRVRNRGNKPIRSYTAAWLTSVGLDGKWNYQARTSEEWLMPGQLEAQRAETKQSEIIPLTDDLRRQLKLQGSMQAVVVLMAVRVEFADGSVFDDEPVYKSLKEYFEKLKE